MLALFNSVTKICSQTRISGRTWNCRFKFFSLPIKTYFLSSAVYSCEVWSPKTLGLKSLAVAWNNAFRKKSNTMSCWRESTRSLQLFASTIPYWPVSPVVWKKMTVSSNRLLLVLSRLCQSQINSIAAKYGTEKPLVNASCTGIKRHVWDTFAFTVLWFYVPFIVYFYWLVCACCIFNFDAVFWRNKE